MQSYKFTNWWHQDKFAPAAWKCNHKRSCGVYDAITRARGMDVLDRRYLQSETVKKCFSQEKKLCNGKSDRLFLLLAWIWIGRIPVLWSKIANLKMDVKFIRWMSGMQTCHSSRNQSETPAIALPNAWHALETFALFSEYFCPYCTTFIYFIIEQILP